MIALIGADEAGYGPHLGPLVVTATRWDAPDAACEPDLYELLAAAVAPDPQRADGGRMPIGDSKRLYRAGGALAALEGPVLAALEAAGGAPASWRELAARLAPESLAWLDETPWERGYDRPLPAAASADQIAAWAGRLRAALDACGGALRRVRCAIITPHRLNQGLLRQEEAGEQVSKGTLLTQWTLELVAGLLDQRPEGPAVVQCDRHGGRKRYAAFLQQVAGDRWVRVGVETDRLSVYRWGPPGREVQWRFAVGGERFLPAALASMVSKYVRQLAMEAWHRFWADRLPGLRPTEGYGPDARRYVAQIREAACRLNVPDAMIWRRR